MCLHVDAEEHELRDLGEPANYKAAMLDPKSDKWLNAMNVEMQSMRENEVWDLVDLPPNDKIIRHKWLFKKKTNMDGAVHTYKARLVAKGFTQTPGIDYEEPFSPVADIRAIRILIAITAFYDYEIWQMDGKTAYSMDISMKRFRVKLSPITVSIILPTICWSFRTSSLIVERLANPIILVISLGVSKSNKLVSILKTLATSSISSEDSSSVSLTSSSPLIQQKVRYAVSDGSGYAVFSYRPEQDDQEIDEPQSDIKPIRRSTRTRRATDRLCLHVDVGEHELGDLGEPANYKATLLDPESDKWLNAINLEMQSMRDNESGIS
ncbi:putative retrotransposon ty1-copia subclass protein [Tanacetum coccineum]